LGEDAWELVDDWDAGLSRDGRRGAVEEGAFAHLGEDVKVEEVHGAEDEEDGADLGAERLKQALEIRGLVAVFQGERDVADIDEVEADDEEVIDGIGKAFVAVKSIDQKEASVLMERAGDPDGKGDADEEVEAVGGNDVVHWVISFLFVFSIFCET
jgi:hypothetical protein